MMPTVAANASGRNAASDSANSRKKNAVTTWIAATIIGTNSIGISTLKRFEILRCWRLASG